MRYAGEHVRVSSIFAGRAACVAALVLLPALAVLTLGGCASRTSYAGISLVSGGAPLEIQELAGRAQAGDKHAQLDLGIRYEEGRGVPRNLERAESLYRAAGSDIRGKYQFYLPSASGGAGVVIPARTGVKERGLGEAKNRLQRLKKLRSGGRYD